MSRRTDITAQIKLNKIKHDPNNDNQRTELYLHELVQNYNNRLEEKNKSNKSYQKATIKEFVYPDVKMALYFNSFSTAIDLFPKMLLEVSNDMDKYINIGKDNFNYVLFLWDENGIFAVTGGNGHTVIDRFIDREFGYKFLTYIGKDQYSVVSSAEKSIVGKVFATERVFREEYDYSAENHFGVSIDSLDVVAQAKYIQSIFNIPTVNKRKTIACNIDNGLLLKKRVTLSKMIEIVKILLELNLKDNEFAFLKVLSNAPKNRSLIVELDHELWSRLYVLCHSQGEEDFEFDIMGPKTSEFISASEYALHIGNQVFYEPSGHFSEIKDYFIQVGFEIAKEHGKSNFMYQASRLYLRASDSDGNELSDIEFFDHISCELVFDGKTYFRINQKWSYVDEAFKTTLIANFKRIVSENVIKDLFETKYLGQKEGDYIEELCKEAGTFKLHQLNPDSKHEFCDIIKVQDSKIYIIHVKVGTGVAIRELTQQIDLSAIRFRETRASLEQTYFDDIYNSLYINGRSKGVTKEYFTNLLKNGEVYFVAMICSNKGEADLAEAIDSSIAQYSLVNLIYQKNSYGYPVCLYPMLV